MLPVQGCFSSHSQTLTLQRNKIKCLPSPLTIAPHRESQLPHHSCKIPFPTFPPHSLAAPLHPAPPRSHNPKLQGSQVEMLLASPLQDAPSSFTSRKSRAGSCSTGCCQEHQRAFPTSSTYAHPRAGCDLQSPWWQSLAWPRDQLPPALPSSQASTEAFSEISSLQLVPEALLWLLFRAHRSASNTVGWWVPGKQGVYYQVSGLIYVVWVMIRRLKYIWYWSKTFFKPPCDF